MATENPFTLGTSNGTNSGSCSENEFSMWLDKKLMSLEVDSEIYGSYIKGVLESDYADPAELKEALEDILSAIVDDPIELCKEILLMWKPFQEKAEEPEESKNDVIADILSAHLAKVVVEAPKTQETLTDPALKLELLAKYSEVYDEEDDDFVSDESDKKSRTAASDYSGLFQNINAKSVTDAEKKKRDKQKEDYQKKKERDKLDREKQKLKKEERKEKEKKRTQKKERSGR